MRTAVSAIDAAIASGHKDYLCVTGVHGIMEAQRDEHLRTILNNSFLTIPDGMPTVWVGKWQGFRGVDRVYGPDLMLEICELSITKSYTHFLYGGEPGVAEWLKSALEGRFPGTRILGSYCPPFRPLNKAIERELIERVADLKPGLFWAGLARPSRNTSSPSSSPKLIQS